MHERRPRDVVWNSHRGYDYFRRQRGEWFCHRDSAWVNRFRLRHWTRSFNWLCATGPPPEPIWRSRICLSGQQRPKYSPPAVLLVLLERFPSECGSAAYIIDMSGKQPREHVVKFPGRRKVDHYRCVPRPPGGRHTAFALLRDQPKSNRGETMSETHTHPILWSFGEPQDARAELLYKGRHVSVRYSADSVVSLWISWMRYACTRRARRWVRRSPSC
jgi:hypothetical protein